MSISMLKCCVASVTSDSDPFNHAPEVSVVGSPLFTDDDRRELPALYHQDQQGGNSESKHLEIDIVDDEFPMFLPEVIDRACVNFARVWSVPVEAVNADIILERSPSLGIAGWSDPALMVLDNGLVDAERRMRERHERSLGGSS